MRLSAQRLTAIAVACLALAGCSSRVERFDRPSWGLKGETSAPPAAEDRYTPQGESAEPRRYGEPYSPPAATAPPSAYFKPTYEPAPNVAPVPSAAPPPSSSPYAYRGGRDPVTGRADLREGGGDAAQPLASRDRTYYDPSSTSVVRPYPDAPRTPTGSGEQSVEVQPGDTLYAIARRHNVTVAELKSVNQLTSDSIAPGQRLSLPIR